MLEDKLEVREENHDQKITCTRDLTDYESLENEKNHFENKIEEIKSELKLKSLEVQQARDKIHKLIDSMTSMSSAISKRSPTAKNNYDKLTQLADRLASHNLV